MLGYSECPHCARWQLLDKHDHIIAHARPGTNDPCPGTGAYVYAEAWGTTTIGDTGTVYGTPSTESK